MANEEKAALPTALEERKIIIIGSGMSGVSCAFHLLNFGFKNVLILEAKDRVGGRLHTLYDCVLQENKANDRSHQGKYHIEFGCQWIHGQEGNLIYDLAHSHNLVDETAPSYMDAVFNFRNQFSEEESEAILSLLQYLDEQVDNIPKDTKPDLNLADFLEKEFECYLKQHTDMTELLRGAFIWYSLAQCELNGCMNLSTLSAALLNQYEECDGNKTTVLKNGYRSVLDVLLKNIPEELILLGKKVKKVDWSDFDSSEKCKSDNNLSEDTQKIKVICDNKEILEADHVICTSSLGYLKKYMDSLFLPSLPSKKIKAIQSIGFGTVNKIFLEFETPFWKPAALYHVGWNSCLYETVQGELKCLQESSDWIYFINRFAFVSGQPYMLCAWITGEGAITMEKIPEEEVMSLSMLLLEKVIGKKLPKPIRIIRSTWNSDPHTHGSYSYLSTESSASSNLDLAEPVFPNNSDSHRPVLQFAGEATHPKFYSTVHGAYETGLREAQRLFEHYRYI